MNENNKKVLGDLLNKTKEVAGNTAKEIGEKSKGGIKIVAQKTEETAKKAQQYINAKNEENKIKKDIETRENYKVYNYSSFRGDMPRLISIKYEDKTLQMPHLREADGYIKDNKELDILCLFDEKIEKLKNIKFIPNNQSYMYIRNPYAKNEYIDMNCYNEIIRKGLVSEIANIANYLGAKKVTISIDEFNNEVVKSKKEASANGGVKGNKGGVEYNIDSSQKTESQYRHYSEMTFDGSEKSEKPKLVYYKNIREIKDMINWCIVKHNKPKNIRTSIEMKQITQMNTDQAAQIDGVLKVLKIKGNASFKKELEKENNTKFEYYIEF